jgi:hypothetical protein
MTVYELREGDSTEGEGFIHLLGCVLVLFCEVVGWLCVSCDCTRLLASTVAHN